MAIKQTRRSISFNAETYLAVSRAAADAGMSRAAWLEDVINEELGKIGLPSVSRAEALDKLKSYPNTRKIRRTEEARLRAERIERRRREAFG